MEFTDKPHSLPPIFEQESLLHRITNRIRRSLELNEILTAAVEEVRELLGTDRVMVYRFDADGSGEVITESLLSQNLPSLLGLHFPADDIPQEAKQMFLWARQRTIVDVSTGKIGLSLLNSPDQSQTLLGENIYYRSVDQCHIKYLQAMGVQSSLVIPIVLSDLQEPSNQQKLWGLLVSHHSQPRHISTPELKLVQQIADQLTIAIAQSLLLAATRAQQHRETVINHISSLLHKQPNIELQAALKATIQALGGTGGRLYLEKTQELYTYGEQPNLPQELNNSLIEQHPMWITWMAESKPDHVWVISDLYQETKLPILAFAFQSTTIRGLLVIPLHYRQRFIGVISIFRPEWETEILWAGRCEQNQRQKLPQLSFEVWRELRKGQAPQWSAAEIALGKSLASDFAVAIQQLYTHQQLELLNLDLECRVKEQTAELEKSYLITKVIKQVTEQIRRSLDLPTTLKTIVSEVRFLLNSDRVLIYQLMGESNGEVIVEEVHGNWDSVLGMKMPSGCFPDEYARLFFRGRVRVINNIATDSLSDCHREFLQSLQIKSNLIVPINMSQQPWGLLIAHQCDAPRYWQEAEINLLQQLADQAAIAISQAQLYHKTCQAEAAAKAQAIHLEKALFDLQDAQTKLIQHEKMSSLGQLVAGIAHEINNPINFIHGNLCHASDYAQQLLELISLYQKYHPQPHSQITQSLEDIDLDFLVEDLPKILASMQSGADRIRSIILSLRNFSRLDEAERKSVDIHEGINSTLLILQHRLKSHLYNSEIEVIKDYSELPLVECYAGQMNQVFMNIFANAIDALEEYAAEHPDTPKIYVCTQISPDTSHVLIRIADNGPGMTIEIKNRIFDPFFTTKSVGKGTGLGLAISYQIVVNNHGGVMECVSEINKGTEFWIEIPVKLKTKLETDLNPIRSIPQEL
ncbi:GAF domain-containing protein [Nostoc sp. CENA543]|uniref:GAF domain-containing sensor histidine kinase n=1 Tax=Nostoc sp. CENA543 TaxID=1869241 RepID=UPI000CA1FF1D|nr:GAF domain-containing protein [Nostoc sp. CENA543]AUS99793.1 GAF domain-containing protein [Nostoc sp. CENA543]